MNTAAIKILQHLTGEKEIGKVSIESLEKLAEEHPYFPLVQLYLVKKLKDEKSEKYLAQLQKSALYFTNPHWLNFQLKTIEQPIIITTENTSEEIIDNEAIKREKRGENSNHESKITEQLVENETSIVDDFELVDNIEPVVEGNLHNNSEEIVEAKESGPIHTELVNKVEEQENIQSVETSLSSDEIEENNQPKEKQEEQLFTSIEVNSNTIETIEIAEETEVVVMDEHEQMFQNIKALLDSTSTEANAGIGNETVPIDPYHTIDYFASQGIHVDLDKNPDDKLGKNLKKFTQWLRHMKKLGPEDAIETNVEAEAEIQQIANSSNIIKEIVTEAMAQVLEKQGKKDKAIELYNKLCFLYPHKIPYFADQIKKLKGD